MKKILGNVLVGIVGLYFISIAVMAPYYNWQYAKEHGFIKWLFLGEIVVTLKSTAWPYFAFFSDRGSQTKSPDERHYVNSKKACDEAMKIIVKTGDVARLPSEDKAKVADLLGLAIAEANQVQPGYLEKVHPQFAAMYEKNYKYAINLLIEGFRTDNTQLVLAGAYGYNEFAEWMQAHAKNLSF
jgi:hypothetical protein